MGDILDLIIIIFIVRAALRGRRIGFARQAGSLIGYVVGLTIAILIAPLIERLIVDPSLRILVVVICVYGVAGRNGPSLGNGC